MSTTKSPKTSEEFIEQPIDLFGSKPQGFIIETDAANVDLRNPLLYYSHPHGQILLGDAAFWLRTLASESVDLVFADPPYSIKKAEWDTFESQQAYVEWSLEWIEQAARVLKPTGTLYICGFSEILADTNSL